MSEENINNTGGEETAALFVSAQKKKKAAEEARIKAEAEQAKRDAAEAEVRRMEQEVEERKRKAEEERIALENEQRERELQAKREASLAGNIMGKAEDLAGKAGDIAGKAGELAVRATGRHDKGDEGGSGSSSGGGTGSGNKTPIFIGIGVAVVALIAILAVVIGGKKGSGIDYANVNCNAEYKIQKEGYITNLYYPEELYKEITEEEKTDGSVSFLTVSFKNANKKAPNFKVNVYNTASTPEAAQFACDTQADAIKNVATAYLGDKTIKDESVCDLTASDPGAYYYKSTYEKDKESGAISSLFKVNDKGVLSVIIADFSVNGTDPAQAVAMRDLYESKNMANALKMPGGNPPTSYDWDGTMEFPEINFKLNVPKDRFKEFGTSSGKTHFFVDDNGCFVMLAADFYSTADDFGLTDDQLPAVMTAFEGMTEKGLSQNMDISSRMLLTKTETPYYGADFSAEYKDVINGVTYWEMDWVDLWVTDSNDIYIFSMYIYAPENNKEQYKTIFEKAIKNLG